MKSDELDFDLPRELIAQSPSPQRSDARLLHYRRVDCSIAHRQVSDLPSLLTPGDLLVFNDARVLPARFTLQKASGGKINGLFLHEMSPGRWRVMLKNMGSPRGPVALRFTADPQVRATVTAKLDEGQYELAVDSAEPAPQLLSRVGRMPLPPYIKRARQVDRRDDDDRLRYQTVYATSSGSVAAPTAGLHFTESLLAELAARGIERTFVTLHVGQGTFKAVTADTLEGHAMHSEAYTIAPAAAEALNRAKHAKRRIVAVGTTAARVLESQSADQPFQPTSGQTSIFIYPPYRWKHVDALMTNFHLPRSTLIALVAALVGLEEQRRIYRQAIEQRYRFFSYGDAMLLE
jgi:S-adenosylmethionine:tRNA ribosyltransferase-isomerase